MPESPHVVPMLPSVVTLSVVALLVLSGWLWSRRALTLPRVGCAVAVSAYAGGIVANTVFPFLLGGAPDRPAWWLFVNLTPLVGTEPVDMAANVLVFVPLGVLLPLVARVDSVRRVVLWGFLVSLAMEVTQLVNAVTGHGGHVADVNDLLANTLGALVGYGGLRAATLLPSVARLVVATQWPGPAASTVDRAA